MMSSIFDWQILIVANNDFQTKIRAYSNGDEQRYYYTAKNKKRKHWYVSIFERTTGSVEETFFARETFDALRGFQLAY